MNALKQALDNGIFGITAEMAPPKGYDLSECVETAKLLRGKVHCVNVTDMQSSCLKATSLGLCIKLKEVGLTPILQMTGRDRNRMALQAELFSAAAFGIDSVLALTGDHPTIGDVKEAKPVFDLDSVGILNMISEMERTGLDCGGNEITAGVPKFFKGATVTPVYDPMFLQINKLHQKVEAGAQYIQTQGIFDVDQLKRFMDGIEKAGFTTRIMAGIIPLKGVGMAKYMNANVPGIRVTDQIMDKLAQAGAEEKEKGVKGLAIKVGMEIAAEMIAKIKEEKICSGAHIMAIGAEKNVPTILEMAGITI